MSWLDDTFREAVDRLLALWRVLVADGGADSHVQDEDFPPEERWWDPETRSTRPDEEATICRQCMRKLGRSTVRLCPSCGVVLHAACYEDTEGGNAYATEGCEACRHRTYWR